MQNFLSEPSRVNILQFGWASELEATFVEPLVTIVAIHLVVAPVVASLVAQSALDFVIYKVKLSAHSTHWISVPFFLYFEQLAYATYLSASAVTIALHYLPFLFAVSKSEPYN